MIAIALLSVLVHYGLHVSCDYASIEEYVINGEDAAKGDWPWQLSLEVLDPEFRHTCGASLLDNRHALTAAHCLNGRFPDMPFRVTIGCSFRGNEEMPDDCEGIVNVTGAVLHEDYEECELCGGNGAYPNDIAVMYLEEEVMMNEFVQPAVLGSPDIQYEGLDCMATGWGMADEDEDLPTQLQQAAIDVITHAECQERTLIAAQIVEEVHLCVYDSRNVTNDDKAGVCFGDSGGPLQCNYEGVWHVLGAASWVIAQPGGFCNPAFPSVYARATSYIDWIQDKINDDSWKPQD